MPYIPVDDWLRFLDSEYLSGFVRQGGSTVKFAVTPVDRKPDLRHALEKRCGELDYVFIELDAVGIRAHMPQDIFFGLAKQVDWHLLARRLVLRLAGEADFEVGSIPLIPLAGADGVFDAIGRANGLESRTVRQQLRPPIQEQVAKNPGMARDFRVAMSQFCVSDEPPQPLVDWLTGANAKISNVRHYSVHTPINRTTARYFIESALFWMRHAGCAGTVLLFDISRVTVARNPRDGARFYTRAMAVEHYELLREFIDDIDRLSGTLLTVATSPDFIDEDARRSWSIYTALRTRVMDDVRDRHLVNPVAPLVRLA